MLSSKRLLAGLCSLMMLTVTGCSNYNSPVITQQSEQTEISLSWWGNDGRNQYTIEAVEEFERLHPDIKVNCSYSEWSGYEARARVQMISDTEADVMQINYGWISQYSPDGLGYYDINDLYEDFAIENFSEDVLRYGIVDGHQNAIPIAMNAETVYINKTIYDKYGLDVPKTWDDLFKAASVMSKDGIYPLSAAAKSMWLYLIAYTEQAQHKTFLKSDGSLNFNAADFQVMIEFYKRLVDEKVFPQVDFYERVQLDNELYAGSVAWISDAQNYFGTAIENGREIVAADYTTIDGKNPGEGWYAKPATMYAVSKNTEHPKEAGMLLDFLMNSSEMAVLQGIEKGIPLSSSAKRAIESEGLLTGIQYEASQVMENCENLSELNPVLEKSGLIDDFFATANDVMYEVTPVEDACNAFVEKIRNDYF
jgi:oligogalacturonide transport system substrate-binding protein